MEMFRGKSLTEKLKKLLATILTLVMMSSYASMFSNVSKAATIAATGDVLASWKNYDLAYKSGIGYKMNEADKNHKKMQEQQKYLFKDASGTYENLACVRTGYGHDTKYREVDLYKLKTEEPVIYYKLFGNNAFLDLKYSPYNGNDCGKLKTSMLSQKLIKKQTKQPN